MSATTSKAHNYRWKWLYCAWLRRPFLALYCPLALSAYLLLGMVESVLEFAEDIRREW